MRPLRACRLGKLAGVPPPCVLTFSARDACSCRPSMNVKEREESFIEQQVSDLHTVSTQCRETSGCAPRRPALPAETQRGEGAAPVPVSYRLLARARNRCLGGRMMRECKRKNKACGRSRPSPSPASSPLFCAHCPEMRAEDPAGTDAPTKTSVLGKVRATHVEHVHTAQRREHMHDICMKKR